MFEIHSRLQQDCISLGKLELCHLLLMNDSNFPWFILVPETDLPDLLDLPVAQQRLAMDEASRISAFIKRELDWPKVNFGAIGNLVPQPRAHPCCQYYGGIDHAPEANTRRNDPQSRSRSAAPISPMQAMRNTAGASEPCPA